MIDKIRGISIQGKCFLNETKFIFLANQKIKLVWFTAKMEVVKALFLKA